MNNYDSFCIKVNIYIHLGEESNRKETTKIKIKYDALYFVFVGFEGGSFHKFSINYLKELMIIS